MARRAVPNPLAQDPIWPPAQYLEPNARDSMVQDVAHQVGGDLVEYGKSVQGRPLLAMRLPARQANATIGGTKAVLCCANLHGVEWIGGLVALALARATAHQGSAAHALRERADLWVIACANPDGYAATFYARGEGPLAKIRTNANGVDLNRNFPRPTDSPLRWAPGAGSNRPGDATYRGSAPLSEPETASLVALMQSQRFVGSANLHSFMGTMIPARVRSKADFAHYCRLHRAFAQGQRVPYRRLSSRFFDVFTGEQEDFQHHVMGTWAACIEVFPWLASLRQCGWSSPIFWRFNPRDPELWIANDVGALANFLLTTLDLPAPSETYTWSPQALAPDPHALTDRA